MHALPLPPPSSPVAAVVVDAVVPLPASDSMLVAFDACSSLPTLGVPPSLPSYERLEDSDVFVKPAAPASSPSSTVSREVTLFVHGWHQVEPGLLSWTFPTLRAALDAVQRMKNAIGWCVVSGTGWTDLDAARAGGAVLVEQLS